MKSDSRENAEREIYEVKAVQPYHTEEFKQRFLAGKKFSRKQLVEADRHGLIESFEECLEDLKTAVKFKPDELPMRILKDLKNTSIADTANSFQRHFSGNMELAFKLADHFERENQVYAVQTIFEQTKFIDVIFFELQAYEGRL